MKCLHCNGEHPDEFKYCPITGKKIELDVCSNIRVDRSGSLSDLTNEYDYVDFGLPSGTLWAKCNVGAESPEEPGAYFSYGHLRGRFVNGIEEFTYIYKRPDFPFVFDTSKLNGDDLLPEAMLPISMDAARKNMGGNWQIPSVDDFNELRNHCDWNWTNNYNNSGVSGYIITRNNNGNFIPQIFLPVTGYYYYSHNEQKVALQNGERGAYRCANCAGTEELDYLYAKILSISESKIEIGSSFLACSESLLPIRAICKKNSSGVPLSASVKCAKSSRRIDFFDIDEPEYKADDNYLGYGYVNLGLPSGTLWATCNVGADNPWDYGDYFAWGEVKGAKSGKRKFDWKNYKWCDGDKILLTKYCPKYYSVYFEYDKAELDLEDDAAYVNWGENWRTPSKEQLDELETYCTSEWINLGHAFGCKVTGRNGKSIFLPAAGCYAYESFDCDGTFGVYMSRTLASKRPICTCSLDLCCTDFKSKTAWNARCIGYSVRPVLK